MDNCNLQQKSLLSLKISVCASMKNLNKTEWLDVIQMITEEVGLDTMKRLLLKQVMSSREAFCIQQLENIINKMNVTIENSQDSQLLSTNTDKNDTLFPLCQLPFDIIRKTSLFLNEKDIFKFEQCCRSFYQMINNLSYLNQSNNFKTFNVTLNTCFFQNVHIITMDIVAYKLKRFCILCKFSSDVVSTTHTGQRRFNLQPGVMITNG